MSSILEALEQALNVLTQSKQDNRLEAEILLSHVLHKNRAYLYAHPEHILTAQQLTAFQELITGRAQGMPIAYLTGQRDFWSLTLKVNKHTLIPRHETERLVELALELIPDSAETRILDLGTGSGAIALALAKEKPHWHITACDFSQDALAVAKENAKLLQLSNVHFIHSNWFSNLPDTKYHAIISNPPYIDERDPHLHQGDLKFEPLSALVSSQNGLADLEYIIKKSYDFLLPEGVLLLEHGYDQKDQIRSIIDQCAYEKSRCWQDVLGHDRVSGGWRPKLIE